MWKSQCYKPTMTGDSLYHPIISIDGIMVIYNIQNLFGGQICCRSGRWLSTSQEAAPWQDQETLVVYLPPEKYEFVSWGYEIPNIWKFKKHDWNHHDSAKKRRQFHVLLPPLRFLRTASTCPPRSQAQLRMVLEPVEDRRIRTSCLAFLGLNAQQSGLPPWDSCDRRILLVKAEVLQHPTMWGPLDS